MIVTCNTGKSVSHRVSLIVCIATDLARRVEMATQMKIVDIPKEFRKAEGTLTKELVQALNVTGEDKYVEDVLKARGVDTKEGAVAVITKVVNGKVDGMKFAIVGGGVFHSDIALEKFVKGTPAGIFLRLKIKLELFEWPAGGEGMRNISAWLDKSDVDWNMFTMEGEEEVVLSPEEREARGVDVVKFALRSTMTVDCKKALLQIVIIPVAASEIAAKIGTWEKEIQVTSEEIPGVRLACSGFDNPRMKYTKAMPVGPLEKAEDGVNMGLLPLFDFGETPENVQAAQDLKIPTRRDLALNMEKFMNKRAGRCHWTKTTGVISELFEGQKKYADLGIVVEKPKLKWPAMVAPVREAATPGEPTRVSRPKYGEKGNVRRHMIRRLSLPAELEAVTVDLVNASLASSTWRCYDVGERAAARCERETGVDMSIPWDEKKAIVFATHCARRNLAATTIRQYLVGIKNAHRRMGLCVETWDSFILKQVIRGRQNTEAPRKQKIPMSPGLMAILRERIKFSNMPAADKAVVWACCAMMYAGSLRGGEVLGDNEEKYDPAHTLMTSDIELKCVRTEDGQWKRFILATIRNPKELRGLAKVEVEMFESGTELCPVKAIQRALKYCKKGRPFATLVGGRILTKKNMNMMLRKAFKGIVDYEVNTLSSHSFRSGLASCMARQGYSDEEIKRQGR